MSQDSRKINKDRVRFEEETVWMSLEDFQKGKVKDLQDVKNLRIEQDFDLSKPEDCKQLKNNKLISTLDGNEYEEDENQLPTRKLTNKQEIQKIQLKKVIDGLDLWDNELKLKKRQEAMKDLFFITQDKSNLNINNKQKDPELNMRLLNSIINMPEEETNKSYKGNRKNKYINKENQDTQNIDANNDEITSIDSLKENQQRNSLIMAFPKSLNSIPNRPVTLTSLKMKKIDDFKHKTVSRYSIDNDKKVVMKTDAQLQAEQNNQIINQIFKNKLSKVIENEKPQNKDEYQDIVNNQTILFKKDTLSKFKSLNHISNAQEKGVIINNVRDPSHPKYGTIEYQKLYNELFEDKLIKKNTKLEQEKISLLSQTKYLDDKEKNMLITYKTHSHNCKSLKESLNLQRVLLNLNTQKNKNKIEELKVVEYDYNKEIITLEKANVQSISKQKEEQLKNNQILISIKSLNYQIELLQEKKIEVLADIQRQIDQLNEEQKSIQISVEQTLKDYESAKEKKNEIKFMLKKHYMNNLKQEVNEKNSKSLVYTIMKLFSIKEQVTFNMLPEYLEEKSIEFLIQLAKLEQDKNNKQIALNSSQNTEKIQKIKQMSIQTSQLQIPPYKKQRNNSTVSLSSSTTFSPISQYLPESTFKLSQISKPILTYNPKREKNQQITFQFENQPQFSLNDSITPKLPVELREIKFMEEQINQLENDITQLKQKEFERLCLRYLKESLSSKNIFNSLFGYFEGEKYNLEFERRKLKSDQIISANKTFQFSFLTGTQGYSIQRKFSIGQNPLQQNSISQNGKSTQQQAGNNNQENKLITDNSNSFSNSKINTQNTMRSTSYSLSLNDRKSSDSLPESILGPIKRNQVLLGIKKQSDLGEIKSSVDILQNKDKQDIFQYFSPRISTSLQKQLIENNKKDLIVSQNRISNQSVHNQQQQLNNAGDKKHVTFDIKEIKSQTNFQKAQNEQNLRLSQQKAPFLSLYFTPPDEKNGFSALQSPINSPNSLITSYSQINESKFQQNLQQDQMNKYQNLPKSVLRTSKFSDNLNINKQFE